MALRRYSVKEWMTPDPVTIDPHTILPEASRLMKECNIRRLPVVEKGQLVGIVTLGDIREAAPAAATALSIYELTYTLARMTVDAIMTRDPFTVSPDTSIEAAARLMLDRRIGGLPVVADGRLVGIITESDIFRLLIMEGEPRATFA